MTLRIILLVLAFLVAVTAFAYGFREMTNREPGYYEIVAKQDESASLYTNGYRLYCYFDGKSNEIKQEFNAATALYEESMGRIYRLLDAYNTYDGYVNLATLNQNLNTVQKIPTELYTVLTDAEQRLDRYGLNLYDGILRSNWEAIRYLEEPLAYDPIYNADVAERMEKIKKLITDRTALKLEVIDASSCTVRLTASESFLSALADLEETAPVLELGVLREAYTLMYVAGKLNAAGFTRGYMTTDSGLAVLLKDTETGAQPLYTYSDNQLLKAADITLKGSDAICILRAFPLEGDIGYYMADDVFRHPYLSENGEPNRTLLAGIALSDGDIVETCITVMSLFTKESDFPEDAVKQGNITFGWIAKDNPKVIYAEEKLIARVTANTSDGIQAKPVS